MSIGDVAFELYGTAPEDFIAARNARVKELRQSGDRELAAEVQALRRPTAGAWILNQLARGRRGEVEQVLELGIRLRAAQGTMGAADLRALDSKRRRLTRAVAEQAAAVSRDAGRKVSGQVVAEVEETLRSAMVDPDAGAALAGGMLVDTFSSNGLEPVDLSSVVALGRPAVHRVGTGATTERVSGGSATSEQLAATISAARHALAAAETSLEAAREAAVTARQRSVEAQRRLVELRTELDAAHRRVADLGVEVGAATELERSARRSQVTATRDELSATETAARARKRLDTVLGDDSGA